MLEYLIICQYGEFNFQRAMSFKTEVPYLHMKRDIQKKK